jgi:hypothetical protein
MTSAQVHIGQWLALAAIVAGSSLISFLVGRRSGREDEQLRLFPLYGAYWALSRLLDAELRHGKDSVEYGTAVLAARALANEIATNTSLHQNY